MNHTLTLALAALCVAAAAHAEKPAAPAAGAKPLAAGARLTATEVRAQCRDEARSQGLKGPDRVASVDACYAKALPERAAALKCRRDGKAKGLAGADLRDFTRQCRANVA